MLQYYFLEKRRQHTHLEGQREYTERSMSDTVLRGVFEMRCWGSCISTGPSCLGMPSAVLEGTGIGIECSNHDDARYHISSN
jgi:hypothetical protein